MALGRERRGEEERGAPPDTVSAPRRSRAKAGPGPGGAKADSAAARGDELLILPVRTMVLFPGVVLPLSVTRPRSLRTIEAAMRSERPVGLLLQQDPSKEEPVSEDLCRVGTVAAVLRYAAGEDGSHLAVCQGQQRFGVERFLPGADPLVASIRRIEEPSAAAGGAELEALFSTLKRQGLEALSLMQGAPAQVAQLIEGATEPGALADMLATFMDIPPSEKQQVLEAVELAPRLALVAAKLGHLLQVLRMSKDIQKQTEATLGKAQREYYLRQQLETIRKELGESDDPQAADLRSVAEDLDQAGLSEEARKEADRELERLRRMPPAAAEAAMIRTWLEVLADLPWSKTTEDVLDLARAREILDRDHHGLERVKRRILEFLAVKKLNPDRKGPILCLVGPPGVGKTSLGMSVASALGRGFVRISLGGLHDEAEIRGHRRTYIGAMPGKILDGLRRAGSKNPVFMLDELDKLGQGFHGDPSSALLEVLDPAQNATFRDNYLNVPFDLSRVLFIGTANVPEDILAALRDRCEVLRIPGYTEEEKLAIARRYLLPRQLSECGLTRGQMPLAERMIARVISDWTREAGVRNLERQLGALARHVAARIAGGERGPIQVRPGDLRAILGPKQHQAEAALRTALPGVATGLAWTPFGGELLFIEATRMPGRGGLILTGQLGEVMRESAQAAVSLLKNRAAHLGIDEKALAENDVHIHVPAGAIPKDGPSAGVAMFMALASLFTARSVRSDTAMTGEISLRGLVLPIGGIRDKVLAAHAAGIRNVLLPEQNRDDYEEVPESARRRLAVTWMSSVDDALAAAFQRAKPARKRARKRRTRRAKAGRRKARRAG